MTNAADRRAVLGAFLAITVAVFTSAGFAQKGNGRGGGNNALPAEPNVVYRKLTAGGVVMLMDTSTGEIGELASGNAYAPSWSPDGTQIAYRRTDTHEILIRNRDGTGGSQYVTTTRAGQGLDWSRAPTPSGQEMLLFCEYDWTGTVMTVQATALDGSDQVELVQGAFDLAEPRWAPTGDRFVCSMWNASLFRAQLTVFTVGLDTANRLTVVGTPIPITDVPAFPFSGGVTCDWSNNGQWITTVANGNVWLIDPTNPAHSLQLTFTGDGPKRYPTFDAADARVFFTLQGNNNANSVRLYSVDAVFGGGLTLESGRTRGVWEPQCRRDL